MWRYQMPLCTGNIVSVFLYSYKSRLSNKLGLALSNIKNVTRRPVFEYNRSQVLSVLVLGLVYFVCLLFSCWGQCSCWAFSILRFGYSLIKLSWHLVDMSRVHGTAIWNTSTVALQWSLISMNGHSFSTSSTLICYFLLNGSWQLRVTIKVQAVLLYTVDSDRSRLDWGNVPAELIMLTSGVVDGNLAFTSNQERGSCHECAMCHWFFYFLTGNTRNNSIFLM